MAQRWEEKIPSKENSTVQFPSAKEMKIPIWFRFTEDKSQLRSLCNDRTVRCKIAMLSTDAERRKRAQRPLKTKVWLAMRSYQLDFK